MPMIQQPANQIKLTNVSLVRFKKGKKRFELACYKNKLLEYRSGTETDLDNGGKKGKSKQSEEESNEKSWKDAIIEEILKKGEIQVNANERKELLDRMEREIVDEVAQRLVDPQTKRVYTPGMIKKGLDVLSKQGGHAPQHDSLPHRLGKLNLGEATKRGQYTPIGSSEVSELATPAADEDAAEKGKARKSDLPMWTGVVATKSVKIQALDAIRALIAWQPIPVMRARMRLRITCPTSIAKQTLKLKGDGEGSEPAKTTIRERILSFVEQVESQDVQDEEWEVIGFVEPGAFKSLGEFCSTETKGRCRVEVLDAAVTHSDD
ncbi:hypothetical protein DV738_g5474, partial [Chaetothyriales sp. CBS 135597]